MAEQQPPIRTGLLDFFRKSQGCQFVIPVYQRNYTWTAGKEVAQYLEDLESVLHGQYNNHFLGILIYLDTQIDAFTREFSVIDGQQRLTTTFIILYVIKALLKEAGSNDQITNMEGQYLTNPFTSNDKAKYKLKPLVSDDEVYQKIIEEKLEEVKETDSNVFKNYNYIYDRLKKLVLEGFTPDQVLIALNKLYVVCVPISEDDNAQKIFESINATGAKLTASDLIRNYILMDIPSDDQERFYRDYWKKIEEFISGDSKKLELFFRMYLAVRTRTLPSKSSIYRTFVSWLRENPQEKEELLKDIVTYADAYYSIYSQDLEKLDSSFRDSVKEFRRILSDMPAPALMELYLLFKDEKISGKTLDELIATINSYLIRRAACDLDTSSISRMFPTFIRDVMVECDDDYSRILDIARKNLVLKNAGNAMYMPTDVQMREMIVNANMYSIRATLRIFFDKLEHKDNPAPVDLTKLSVEHIMPQSMPKEWLKELNVDEETYLLNLNRLGNLTLCAKPDNSSMGAKLWQYKNKILKSINHLKINEKLLGMDHWTIDDINTRTDELINRLIELYPYPKIDEDIIQREEIFLSYKNGEAVGYLSLEDGSVEVDVGSVLNMRPDGDKFPNVEDMRQELIEEGYIAVIEGTLQFVKPYIFYSSFKKYTALSAAASFIAHGSKNGWFYWKDKDGNPIGENPKLKERFGADSSESDSEE